MGAWTAGRLEQHQDNITVRFQQEYFRTRFVYDPRRRPIWREVTRWIERKFLKEGDRVLDLGAGYCDFINSVTVASERYAFDVFQRLGEFAGDGVEAVNGNAVDLSRFGDSSLDVVFASNLFEHLTHDELLRCLAELRRVLAPSARLILMQPNFKYCPRTYFDDYTHLQIFTHMGLIDLLEMTGLTVTYCAPKFLPVNMKSTLRLNLPRLDLIVRMYLASPFRPRAGQMLLVAENRPLA